MTTRMIQIEDYYAPKFRVPVLDAGRCEAQPRRAHIGHNALFRTTHPEPWRPGASRLAERSKRFTGLSRA
jgi:hypothetical protein